jgi:hypothetical protein
MTDHRNAAPMRDQGRILVRFSVAASVPSSMEKPTRTSMDRDTRTGMWWAILALIVVALFFTLLALRSRGVL